MHELQQRYNEVYRPTEFMKAATFSNFTVDNENDNNAIIACKEFLTNNNKGLFVSGSIGRGKTHLLYAVNNALQANGKLTVCINMQNLLNAIYNDYGRINERALNLTEWAQVLLIDDIDKFDNSKINKVQALFFQIVNNRYENKKPVCITTNANLSELKNLFGDATLDRLRGMCKSLVLTGKTRR